MQGFVYNGSHSLNSFSDQQTISQNKPIFSEGLSKLGNTKKKNTQLIDEGEEKNMSSSSSSVGNPFVSPFYTDSEYDNDDTMNVEF